MMRAGMTILPDVSRLLLSWHPQGAILDTEFPPEIWI